MARNTLRSFGEFGLIRRITRRLGSAACGSKPAADIGDDAFVGPLPAGTLPAITTDMLIEDVHFRRAWTSFADLGWKAMAVNLSDLAAMGRCAPVYAVVSLALPRDTAVTDIDALYAGMAACGKKYGCRIVGGDTVASPAGMAISITLTGAIRRCDVVKRSGCAIGDLIVVSGTFGDSGAGLALLQRGIRKSHQPHERFLLERHRRPRPRLDISLKPGTAKLFSSLTDASDGLAVSLELLNGAGRCGAHVDLEIIPLSAALRNTYPNPMRAFAMALYGGEDYELVGTARPADARRLTAAVPELRVIGTITKGSAITYFHEGKKTNIPDTGFKHFGR